MEGGGAMWVAEVGTGLKGAIGTPSLSGKDSALERPDVHALTLRFRETKTIGPGSGQGPASDYRVTLGK